MDALSRLWSSVTGETTVSNRKNVSGAILAVGLFAAVQVPPSATAATVFYNEYYNGVNIYASELYGDCSFNTVCAPTYPTVTDFVAAQKFTISAPATIRSASLQISDFGVLPSSLDWAFYTTDGGGLPGTRIAGANSALTSSSHVDDFGRFSIDELFVDLGIDVTLGAGTYYFALQAVTTVFDNYLLRGILKDGAAESRDGGATWTAGYQGHDSVAVGLYDTTFGASPPSPVPLPGALPLLASAVCGLGVLRRLKRSRGRGAA